MTEVNQLCQGLDKNVLKAFVSIKYCAKNIVWTKDLMKFKFKFFQTFLKTLGYIGTSKWMTKGVNNTSWYN